MTDIRLPTRRLVLASAMTGGIAGIAGCLNGPQESEADNTGNDTDDSSNVFANHEGNEPIGPPDDHRCNGVCGMSPAEYPAWSSQIAHADNTGAFFCSLGCHFAYRVAPEHVEANETTIVNSWVTDYDSGELIDADNAFFVLEDDPDEQESDEPMGINPRAFAEESEAIKYVDARDHLVSSEAIITYDAIDVSIAKIYQGNRLPQD